MKTTDETNLQRNDRAQRLLYQITGIVWWAGTGTARQSNSTSWLVTALYQFCIHLHLVSSFSLSSKTFFSSLLHGFRISFWFNSTVPDILFLISEPSLDSPRRKNTAEKKTQKNLVQENQICDTDSELDKKSKAQTIFAYEFNSFTACRSVFVRQKASVRVIHGVTD